jgi:hypothetical protein
LKISPTEILTGNDRKVGILLLGEVKYGTPRSPELIGEKP